MVSKLTQDPHVVREEREKVLEVAIGREVRAFRRRQEVTVAETYNMFLAGAKYGTIVIVALMIAMAIYFFSGTGAIVSILAFLVMSIGGSILAR